MKPLLISTGVISGLYLLVLFLKCPVIFCSTPSGYLNWVRYETEAFGEVLFGKGTY